MKPHQGTLTKGSVAHDIVYMRQADAEQVGSDFLDAALALFEERPQGASLSSVTQSEHDVHLR